MNAVSDTMTSCMLANEAAEEDGEDDKPFELKKLTPAHKQALSLLAQGVPQATIATVCDFTPTYVSMLARMPICKEYVAQLTEAHDLQLEAMFVGSVEAIGHALQNGKTDERLAAAKLQLQATKRIGKYSGQPRGVSDTEDRLVHLSERLVGLLESYSAHANHTNAADHATVSINARVLQGLTHDPHPGGE